MNIIITGGAGFIGSTLVRHIINCTNHNVINVDKLTYAGNIGNLIDISSNKNYIFEKVDICDAKKINNIFEFHKPDAVMHLAAESHVDRSINNPSNFIETNIIGTYTLLEATRNYWTNLKNKKKDNFRFHHISTDEVYGDLKLNEPAFTEKTSYAPSSPYSASKASSDHLVRSWGRTYGLPFIITNCSNNYGPYQFPEKFIPLIIMNAISGNSLPIYGDGTQIRDWLYVEDHAVALLKVLEHGVIGETYNIGGNNEISNLEVVKTICQILQEVAPSKNNYSDLISFVDDRPGHDKRYAINADKISSKLGWYPEETFKSGLTKTVNWYLRNLDWCKKLDK